MARCFLQVYLFGPLALAPVAVIGHVVDCACE
jgi:hypothetical protein